MRIIALGVVDQPGRRLGLLVAFALFAALGAAAAPVEAAPVDGTSLQPGGTFIDDDRSFAEGSIEALVAAEIVTGCGPQRFCPDRVVTRAEAAALLVRAFSPTPEGTISFVDVAEEAWYADAVQTLAGAGVIVGHTDGTFRPADGLTRSQMALLLMRMLGVDRQQSTVSRFADVDVDDPYAWAVEQLAERGITLGCAIAPARFCPDEPVRRDQMAVFITRAMDLTPLTPPDRIAPLNGLPIDGLAWHRRVIAVKVDDARDARPQSGVASADAVFETLVEGGRTRWIALFHQSDSIHLGPVRSIRPTDTGLVLPMRATLAASGGQPWIVDRTMAAGVPVIREHDAEPPAMIRIESRVAPYNLYADTTALRALADTLGYPNEPPPPLFDWGGFLGGAPSTRIVLEWSDPISITWVWDGERYGRWRDGEPHLWVDSDDTTAQVSADLLVVIVAPVVEMAPPDSATGSPVPAANTVGEGTAFVFAEGKVIRARWARDGADAPFDLTTLDGSPLALPPGVPWINVFPAGRIIRS